MGVRDPGSYPKFLCWCKRPVEISKISVWIKEARSVGRKVMLPEMKIHGHGYHVDLELSDRSRD